MSLREWLILLGAVIVVGIILDGIRRMHRARKDSLEISRGMGADQLEESPLDHYNPELPSGGARIIDRLGVSARERNEAADRPLASWSAQKGEVEPTEEGLSAEDPDSRLPDDFSLHAEAHDDAERAWSRQKPEAPADTDQPVSTSPKKAPGPVSTLEASPSLRRPAKKTQRGRPRRDKGRGVAQGSSAAPASARADSAAAKTDAPRRAIAGANRPTAKEVFVINVDSKSAEGFRGGDLKRLFEACGLEHGDMGIYHRHENDDTETPVQFSVANAVEPGTFSPSEMENLYTPGISFFMSLPGPTDSLQAYDFMIETAQCVVRNLGGDLKDERRSVMTAQTIEHGRQRVREFERKRRSVKA